MVFSQVESRDIARELSMALAEFRPVSIVASAHEAAAMISCMRADIVLMEASYIEHAQSFRTATPDVRRPMLVVVARRIDASIQRKAENHAIDLVVDVGEGVGPAVDRVRDSWTKFFARDATIDDRVNCVDPNGRSIPVIDDVDRRIVEMIAAGSTDKEIAETVFLSHQTIRNRVSRILMYSGARNRTHLACVYLSLVHEGFAPFVRDDGPSKVA